MELSNVGRRRILDVNKHKVINKCQASGCSKASSFQQFDRDSIRRKRYPRSTFMPVLSLRQTENKERATLIWKPFPSAEEKRRTSIEIIREEKLCEKVMRF